MTMQPLTTADAQAWYTQFIGDGNLPPARWYLVSGLTIWTPKQYAFLLCGVDGQYGLVGVPTVAQEEAA